jgi:WhiB family transcriptional regulator, redox-sensing transcriptional regulator
MDTWTLGVSRQLAGLAAGGGDWRDRALCAEVDPELFFPDKGESSRPAKRVCAACEVRAECLQQALDRGERFGVWGGLSERERRVLERERRVQAGQPGPVRYCPVLYHCPSGRLGHGVTAADPAEAAEAAMLRRAAS